MGTAVGGMGSYRGAPSSSSKIPGEPPSWVLDNASVWLTPRIIPSFPGLPPSLPGGASISWDALILGGCTHLPRHPPTSRAVCVSPSGVPKSWGAPILRSASNFGSCPYLSGCTYLLGCSDLGGLHPSPGVHLSSGPAPIFRGCPRVHAYLGVVPGCTHPRGSPPLWGAALFSWGALTSEHAPILGVHPPLSGGHPPPSAAECLRGLSSALALGVSPWGSRWPPAPLSPCPLSCLRARAAPHQELLV